MPDESRTQADAERRMAAVGSVAAVMRAVWALARAQHPLVEAAAAEAATYVSWAEELVARLAGAPGPSPEGRPLTILVGPERPFCGPLARSLIAQLPEDGPVGLVGTRLAEAAAEVPALADRLVFSTEATATPDEIGTASSRVAQEILGVGVDAGVVVMHPVGGSAEVIHAVLIAGARSPADEPPECFGDPVDVLEGAVLEAIGGRLAVALAEALRSEVRARMAAADAARRACDRQLDELRHQWRVLRQSSITQELLEIVAARRR